MVVLGGGEPGGDGFSAGTDPLGAGAAGFFPKGTQGIVNVDRYAGYFALLGPDWSLKLAYCWSHQRRDFVNVVEVADQGTGWADQWVALIGQLFGTNARRREAWFQGASGDFGPLDQQVRPQVAQLKERMDLELARAAAVEVLAPHRQGPLGPLGRVVIHRHLRMIHEHTQPRPMPPHTLQNLLRFRPQLAAGQLQIHPFLE